MERKNSKSSLSAGSTPECISDGRRIIDECEEYLKSIQKYQKKSPSPRKSSQGNQSPLCKATSSPSSSVCSGHSVHDPIYEVESSGDEPYDTHEYWMNKMFK